MHLRHFSQTQSLETVHLVKQFRGTHAVALGITGDEAGYPLDARLAAFQYAIDRDIHGTAHAGEARSAVSVWETLRHLQSTRIGHGLRNIEAPDLIAHLRAIGTHLELCPSCNVQSGVVQTYAEQGM